jgi:hypothetical protein
MLLLNYEVIAIMKKQAIASECFLIGLCGIFTAVEQDGGSGEVVCYPGFCHGSNINKLTDC